MLHSNNSREDVAEYSKVTCVFGNLLIYVGEIDKQCN